MQELKPELYMEYMKEEKSNRERFKDVNNYKRMMKIHKSLSPVKSFQDLRKHDKEFKEIVAKLRKESRERKEKKEQKKKQEVLSNLDEKQ